MTTMPTARRRSAAGFSLIELLVAMGVFILVVLTAYQVFERSHRGYTRGQNQAEMIQSARVAFDSMVNDVRMTGFEFDIDGEVSSYLDSPDEAMEFMHRNAVAVRANFDFEGDNLRGREAGLERGGQTHGGQCCPIVTTGNDEIIVYALGKNPGEAGQPVGSAALRFDFTGSDESEELDDPGDPPADGDVRDGALATDGTITGEEDITVSAVEVAVNADTGSTFDDPPYVLYKFTFTEDPDDPVRRSPLVDNIRSLTFRYYNETGTEITPNGGADAGRTARWNVRRVSVELVAMEPDPDFRWSDKTEAADSPALHHRKFLLTEDVVPPNMGRRGQLDKSTFAPEPVTAVTLCVGQSGMLRVSWVPGPPEDNVKDYIIQIFENGPPAGDLSNLRGSFVRPANFDLTTNPEQEFVVLTREDDGDIADTRIYTARVIPRNQGGTEGEPTVSAATATITSRTRPEPITEGYATGYDPTTNEWPDAKADNGSAATILTDPLDVDGAESAYYAAGNQIRIVLNSPQFVLNDSSSFGSDPKWSTKSIGSGVAAPMSCHRQESTPAVSGDELRTPVENIPKKDENTYVFRVSGADPWNWNGGLGGAAVTDPRNFIPGPDNLHDFVALPLHTNDVTYVDTSQGNFLPEITGAMTQYDQRFDGTSVSVTGSPKATVPGEVYYYRFRTVSLAWEDDDNDGEDDNNSNIKAWSLPEDLGTNWRAQSLGLSPFYPPLLPVGTGAGQKDEPLQSVHDSDDASKASGFACYAIPGYALPATGSVSGDLIPPEKPTELYLARRSEDGAELLGTDDGIDQDGARLVFNSSKRNAPADIDLPPDGDGLPEDSAFRHYELHRTAATSAEPDASAMDFTPSDSTLFMTFELEGRQALLSYTIDTAAEDTPDPTSHTQLDDLYDEAIASNGGLPYIWRLVATQNKYGLNGGDDGITVGPAERSSPSPPFLFPCTMYDDVNEVDITPSPDNAGTTSVAVDVTMDLPGSDANDDPICTALESARLLAFGLGGNVNGEFLGTSDWVSVTDCSVTFDSTAVDAASRGYNFAKRFEVELASASNSGSGGGVSVGCRVRSDLLGAGADEDGVEVSVCATCGTNGIPSILGSVTDGDSDGDTINDVHQGQDERTLDIDVQNLCGADDVTGDDFDLLQVEVDLATDDGSLIPVFGIGQLMGVEGGTRTLGPADLEEEWGAAGTTLRLRWKDSLVANPPVVDESSDKITLRLLFEDDACMVRVQAFNFRVPVDSIGNDLLCTQRAAGDEDPEPGDFNGEGRGPTTTPPITCATGCDNECVSGDCPVNENMSLPDDVDLLANDDGVGPNSRIRVKYVEDCMNHVDCVLTLSEIKVKITTQPPRDCTVEPLPEFYQAVLHFDDGTPNFNLGGPTTYDSLDGCNMEFRFEGLIGATIQNGQTFYIDLDCVDNLGTNAELDELKLTFTDPLPVSVACDLNAPPAPIPTP